MVRKKTGGMEKEESAAGEGLDWLDTIDAIDGEMAFLKEVLQLMQAASSGKEEKVAPPLPFITDEMLARMEKVKRHCERLFSLCGKDRAQKKGPDGLHAGARKRKEDQR